MKKEDHVRTSGAMEIISRVVQDCKGSTSKVWLILGPQQSEKKGVKVGTMHTWIYKSSYPPPPLLSLSKIKLMVGVKNHDSWALVVFIVAFKLRERERERESGGGG